MSLAGGVGQGFDDACRFDADMDDPADRRDQIARIVEPSVGSLTIPLSLSCLIR